MTESNITREHVGKHGVLTRDAAAAIREASDD